MLDIQAPFGYRTLKPLNRADYVRLPLPSELPPFARDSRIVPLSYQEIVVAAWHYPIIFLHDAASGQHNAAALLGLAQERNAFSGDGGWDSGAYVPAYVRRYPFCMATVVRGDKPQPDLMVCVESECASSDAFEHATRLFREDGQPTAQWQAIEAFLKEYETDLAIGRAFTARLVELDLLEPFTANIARPNGEAPFSVSGMLRVNEARLSALDAQTIASLHQNGFLSRIYVHLFSLQRFQGVLEREAKKSSPTVSPASPAREALAAASAA